MPKKQKPQVLRHQGLSQKDSIKPIVTQNNTVGNASSEIFSQSSHNSTNLTDSYGFLACETVKGGQA